MALRIGVADSPLQQAGISTPTNAALVNLVHQVERSGQFLDPEDVLARVPV